MTEPWNPWAPPVSAPPRPRDKTVFTLAWAIVVVLAAGVVSLGVRGFTMAAETDRAREQRAAAAQKAVDDALARTADTASIPPAADGTKPFGSPAPDSDRYAFHLTLPPGWEGRHVGFREDDTSYTDSVLNGPGGVVVIERIDLGVPLESQAFGDQFVDALEYGEPPMTITTHWTTTTIGEGGNASYVEGTVRQGAEQLTLRVVVFKHGSETFRVDLAARTTVWDETLAEKERILASWLWD